MYTLFPVEMVIVPDTLDEVKVIRVFAEGCLPSFTVTKSVPHSSISITLKVNFYFESIFNHNEKKIQREIIIPKSLLYIC